MLTWLFWDSKVACESHVFKVDGLFMTVVGLRYVVPLVNSLIEAWSNALIFALFARLEKESEIHTNGTCPLDENEEPTQLVETNRTQGKR